MSVEAAPRRGGLPEYLALLAIILLAVWIRVDDLDAFRAAPQQSFADGTPLLLNPDGYFFLSLARDLRDDRYDPVDPLRAAPDGAPRPWPPPALSVLTAALHAATGLPLGWLAALLPAVLGALLALPVHAVGRRLMGPAAGLAAALVAVASHYYVYRTTVGFYDTDALNATLLMCLVGWGLATARTAPARFPGWLLAGITLLALFSWWWQGAYGVVILVAAWCLGCALLRRRASGGEVALAATAVLGTTGLALLLAGRDAPLRLVEHLQGLVAHVTKAPASGFPNIAASIGEQAPASLAQAAQMTLGDPILGVFALAGAIGLLVWRRGDAAMLLPLLVLAALGVLYAQRFLIFAAPLTGLGIGFLVARGVIAAKGHRGLLAAVTVGAAAAAAPSIHRSTSIDFTPSIGGELVEAMRWAGRRTPADAVVWSSWSHGYALRYWSRRATVNDGSAHTGELTIYNALPYAAPTFRLAANFMQFYSVHGARGMQRLHHAAGSPAAGLDLAREIFARDPAGAREFLAATLPGLADGTELDEWLRFLFPDNAPPLYLMMDQRMLRTARWWFAQGIWPAVPASAVGARMQPFAGLSRERDRIIAPRIVVDTGSGSARILDGEAIALSRVVTTTTRGVRELDYARPGPEFHYFAPDGVGVLQDPELARSVFSKAFVLRAAAARYLRPARLWGARVQVWQVRGDALDGR